MAQARKHFARDLAQEVRIGKQEDADVVERPDHRNDLRDIQGTDGKDYRPDQHRFRSDRDTGVGQKKAIKSEIFWGALHEQTSGLPAADTPGHCHEPPDLVQEFHVFIIPVWNNK